MNGSVKQRLQKKYGYSTDIDTGSSVKQRLQEKYTVNEAYLNKFFEDTNNYFSSVETDYSENRFDSAADILAKRQKRASELKERSSIIRRYVDNNKSNIDADAYTSMTSYLDGLDEALGSFDRDIAPAVRYKLNRPGVLPDFVYESIEKRQEQDSNTIDSLYNMPTTDIENEVKKTNEARSNRDRIDEIRNEISRLESYLKSYDPDEKPKTQIQYRRQNAVKNAQTRLDELRTELASYDVEGIEESAKGIAYSGPSGVLTWDDLLVYAKSRDARSADDFDEYVAKGKETATIWAEEDIAAYEKYKRTSNPDAQGEALKNIRTRNQGIIALQRHLGYNIEYDFLMDDDADSLDGMSDDEFDLYAYYLAKDLENGTTLAEEYIKDIDKMLKMRQGAKVAKDLEGNTFGQIVYGGKAGIEQFFSGLGSLLGVEGTPPVSQYASAHIREDLEDTGPKIFGVSLGQIGYDALNSGANMLPSVLTSVAIGTLNPAAGAAVGATLMGGSAGGNAYAQMLELGYSKKEARSYGLLIGSSEALLQYALGGIGKLGGVVTKGMVGKAVSGIDNALAKFAIKFGSSIASEALEEGAQSLLEPVFKSLATGENIEKTDWEQVAYEALLGGLLGGVFEFSGTVSKVHADAAAGKAVFGNKQGELVREGLSHEDGSLANKLAKKYEGKPDAGNALTGTQLYTLANANMEATINESAAKIENELTELGITGDVKKVAQALAKKSAGVELNASERRLLSSEAAVKYTDKTERTRAFEADLGKYAPEQRATIQKAIDSKILNNTSTAHFFVDFVAKISADKGVSFDFINNEKLKSSGLALPGVTVNGYVSGDGITINVNSAKALNSIVGHEITHVLEGTEFYGELQTALFSFAESKGEYQSRYEALEALYKDLDENGLRSELTADLVGDYIFTDEKFVRSLSTEHRNVFQKIYDEIKYLFKTAMAGSAEALELEKIKKIFDKVYRESGTVQKNTADGGVRYSLHYEAANPNEKILELVDRVYSGDYKDSEKVYLGIVSENKSKRIYELTGVDVSGFKIAIEARQLSHIIKDHGIQGITDHSMKDAKDIAKIEYILESPDDISYAGKTQAYSYMQNGKNKTADTVLYEKIIGDKSYYAVQAVPNTKAKTVYIVTAFIGKSGYKKEAPQLINAKSPDATAKTGSANASTYSIYDSENIVNNKNSLSPEGISIAPPAEGYNVRGEDITFAPPTEPAPEISIAPKAQSESSGNSDVWKEVSDSIRSDILKNQNGEQPGAADTNSQIKVEEIEDTGESTPVTRKALHKRLIEGIKERFAAADLDLDEALKKAKNLSTWSTVDNTPQRVMEKALGYKAGGILADETVNKVAQNEAEGIKWLNSITNRKSGLLAELSKKYGIKPGSKESAAAQMYAEGFFVDENGDVVKYGDAELAKDFQSEDVQKRIKGLATDPKIRQFYDETLDAINESRARNAYPEIPRLDNYFLHFRAMEDTFSRLGLPFNPGDIRAKDLPTDLNGVTADLKPGQPYFASSKHRRGKRTSHDLLGGMERYATAAKNQIYHIDDIQTLRALRNYIADTFGQANGLEGLDALSEEEAQEKIKQVYNSHLSSFARFLNEEANIIAGKTSLIDRGIEGIIGRRGMEFINSVNKQVGANMVGFNVSSSLTNFLPVAQAFAKTGKFDFLKGFTQTVSNKLGIRRDSFTEDSPVIIRRKGSDRFYRTPYQKVGDVGYVFMSAVDDISTEIIARAKYNELTRRGMDPQKAHFETDKWVSRLMGDRSLGQMPQLYNSKMLGLITKFQLEVRNQLDSQFYDTIQEAKASNEHIKNGLAKNAKTAAKVTSTLFQLAIAQHLFGAAFEAIAGYNPAFDIIGVIATAFGWGDEEDDEKDGEKDGEEDTPLDNLEEAFFELLDDLPYTSAFTGGRIPIASALPVGEFIKGADEYGNEKPRLETLGESLPYYLLPGGYGQIKKTAQGISMFSDDLPISGSYTDSGGLRFPVEKTPLNIAQAAIFGQWASENASKYFDGGHAPLKEKQIDEFVALDIPIEDYWEIREGLAAQKTTEGKFDYIAGLDLPTEKKNILINNAISRKNEVDIGHYEEYSGLEEFDFANNYPEKYEFLKDNDISYEVYDASEESRAAYNWAYSNPEKYTVSKAVMGDIVTYRGYVSDINKLGADKDANGKSISGSRKAKVINYINDLDLEYGARIILYKSEYKSDDTYNRDIVEYLNEREDISSAQMREILVELGFTVSSDGAISW